MEPLGREKPQAGEETEAGLNWSVDKVSSRPKTKNTFCLKQKVFFRGNPAGPKQPRISKKQIPGSGICFLVPLTGLDYTIVWALSSRRPAATRRVAAFRWVRVLFCDIKKRGSLSNVGVEKNQNNFQRVSGISRHSFSGQSKRVFFCEISGSFLHRNRCV